MGSVIEGCSTSSATRAGKRAVRAPQNGRFLGIYAWFQSWCTSERGTSRPRAAAPVHNPHSFTDLISDTNTLHSSDPACVPGNPAEWVREYAIFDPFAAQRERRAQVWGGQHACLTPTWRQSRRRASYKSYVERGEPSGWSCTAGNPAQAGREREPVGRRKEPPHVLHGARPRAGFLISLNPWAGQYRVYDRYGGRVPSMVGVDGWEGRLRRWEKREGAGAVLW